MFEKQTSLESIVKKNDFNRIFKEKHSLSSRYLLLYFIRSQKLKLGIQISKRELKRAIDRNRLKRVIREYLRKVQTTLPKVEVVILTRKSIGKAKREEIDQCLDELAKKLRKSCKTV